MKTLTLLEQAKLIPVRISSFSQGYTDEKIELVLAWLSDEITLKQVFFTLRNARNAPVTSRQTVYNFLAIALRQAKRQGKILIKKK